jgi:hypothetical protein
MTAKKHNGRKNNARLGVVKKPTSRMLKSDMLKKLPMKLRAMVGYCEVLK